MTREQAGKRYLAAVAPLNAATAAYDAVVKTSPAPTAAGPSAFHLADALVRADSQLLRLAQEYPPIAQDVRALIGADALTEGDLRSIVAQNASTLPTWTQHFAADNAKAATAANVVRTDLGLPPAG